MRTTLVRYKYVSNTFVERTQFTILRNIELPYLRQTPRGVKKIDELRASTVGTEDFNVLLMAFQLHGRLVSPCDVAETSDSSKDSAMPTRSASMRGLADGTYCLKRSTLAMSNSKELYAGKCCTMFFQHGMYM